MWLPGEEGRVEGEEEVGRREVNKGGAGRERMVMVGVGEVQWGGDRNIR